MRLTQLIMNLDVDYNTEDDELIEKMYKFYIQGEEK